MDMHIPIHATNYGAQLIDHESEQTSWSQNIYVKYFLYFLNSLWTVAIIILTNNINYQNIVFRYLEGNHLSAVPKELSLFRHLTLM